MEEGAALGGAAGGRGVERARQRRRHVARARRIEDESDEARAVARRGGDTLGGGKATDLDRDAHRNSAAGPRAAAAGSGASVVGRAITRESAPASRAGRGPTARC